MAIRQTIKQNRDYIILGGIIVGLICWADATNIYDIGLHEYGTYIKFGIFGLLLFAGWTYHDNFMASQKRRRPIKTNPMEDLEGMTPPEMGG